MATPPDNGRDHPAPDHSAPGHSTSGPSDLPPRAGPVLHARGAGGGLCRLCAVVIRPEAEPPPLLRPDGAAEPVAAEPLARLFGRIVWRCSFALPMAAGAGYELDGSRHPVATDWEGELRLAFVSCNGREKGDMERPDAERDAMWRRLAAQHAAAPLHLLLHGGDQLYADEIVTAHPDLQRWAGLPRRARHRIPFTAEMREAARRWLLRRYLRLFQRPAIAGLLARVPSLMMWDDHDIMDGWGSHPSALLDSPVGHGLFEVAREMFALFQLGASAEAPPPHCPDRSSASFAWAARFPGLSVIAPDLRSERRPDRVMAGNGWRHYEALLHDSPPGDRRLVISTVPALGPRLGWVEWLMGILPKAQKYEDDLRDQWQSRAHRAEWRRFLAGLEREMVARGEAVTLLSGEIHLAARGEMILGEAGAPDAGRAAGRGERRRLQQLISSGIAHPRPPSAFGIALGLLARFGGEPLPGRRIRLRPVPGRRRTYTAERNYLLLFRRDGVWSAEWELEQGGRTPPLPL